MQLVCQGKVAKLRRTISQGLYSSKPDDFAINENNQPSRNLNYYRELESKQCTICSTQLMIGKNISPSNFNCYRYQCSRCDTQKRKQSKQRKIEKQNQQLISRLKRSWINILLLLMPKDWNEQANKGVSNSSVKNLHPRL